MAGGDKCVVRGLVLRAVETKESDLILTVLTEELGRISVSAKGARSRRSRIAAACQTLVWSEFTLTKKGGWYYVNEASTLSLFDGVRGDFEKLSLCAWFAQLTEALTEEGEESGEALSLLLNALYALSELDKPRELVAAAFPWRLMAISGFAPLLDGCCVCGEEPQKPVVNVNEGVVHCAEHKVEGINMPLGAAALEALRYIVHGPAKRLYNFSLEPGDLRLLTRAAEAFVMAQLERSFSTLDFYKSLN